MLCRMISMLTYGYNCVPCIFYNDLIRYVRFLMKLFRKSLKILTLVFQNISSTLISEVSIRSTQTIISPDYIVINDGVIVLVIFSSNTLTLVRNLFVYSLWQIHKDINVKPLTLLMRLRKYMKCNRVRSAHIIQ